MPSSLTLLQSSPAAVAAGVAVSSSCVPHRRRRSGQYVSTQSLSGLSLALPTILASSFGTSRLSSLLGFVRQSVVRPCGLLPYCVSSAIFPGSFVRSGLPSSRPGHQTRHLGQVVVRLAVVHRPLLYFSAVSFFQAPPGIVTTFQPFYAIVTDCRIGHRRGSAFQPSSGTGYHHHLDHYHHHHLSPVHLAFAFAPTGRLFTSRPSPEPFSHRPSFHYLQPSSGTRQALFGVANQLTQFFRRQSSSLVTGQHWTNHHHHHHHLSSSLLSSQVTIHCR